MKEIFYAKQQENVFKPEFIVRGDNVSLLKPDNEVVTLKEGIGMLAMNLYNATEEYAKAVTEEEKKGLEKMVKFQSRCLDSMSRALSALGH